VESADDSEWIARHAEAMKGEFLTRLGGGQAVSTAVAEERYVDVLVRSRPGVSGTAMAAESRAMPLSGFLRPPGGRLVLQGEGGTGKTIILLRTVVDLCERAGAVRDAPVAVYVRLNFFDAQANAFGELMNVISRSAQLDRADAEALWAQRRRRCVFLLDGFNEVTPSAREACVLALSELLQHRWHSYLITSRPGDDVDKLALRLDAERLEIVSLSADQVQQFLDSYGLADLPGRIGPRIRDFLRTPFQLWALAQIQAGLPGGELPSSTGRLYQRLIDDYIFGSREQRKTGDSRPMRYHYELVKKPVLGGIAVQMCMAGVTRRPEDRDLLVTIRDRLREIRAKYEEIYPIVPYELMPDPPAAIELLEEAARNGILRRADATAEFAHESIRDYFAAAEMARWPLTQASTNAPALIWRQVTPDFSEYRVDSSLVGSLTMAAGLRDDPESFVRALAERNLLIAAYCYAEAPTPGAADYLAGLLRAMLQHWQPARRWIACQCTGQAGLRGQDLITSLLELARSDTEVFVRDAAARALGRIGDHHTIKQLVTDAFDTAPSSASNFGMRDRDTTRILWRLYSRTAVLEVFDIWRSESVNSDRRLRAQQLLASMDPELVRKTLHGIGIEGRTQDDGAIVQDAERALSQLGSRHELPPRAVPLITAEHVRSMMRLAVERRTREFETGLTELSACSTEELLTYVHDADAITRAAAVTLLQQRHEPTAPDPFLEALSTETVRGVRDALLRALRPLANQPGFMSAWSSRLTDPGWSQVATLDLALSARLPPLGTERLDEDVSLDPDIRADLVGQGVSVDNNASVTAQPGYWDLTPGSWEGKRYENEHSWLRIVAAQGQLCVQDLGKSARLVMAGAALGDRVVPVLRQVLHTDPRSPLLQVAIPEVLAVVGGPVAVHELCVMFLIAEEGNQPIDLVNGPLLEAIASIRSPHATEELLRTLGILASARLHHHQDSKRPPEAVPESDLTKLNAAADALITALLGIGAQTQLAEFAEDAFANGDDTLRYVATLAAARLDLFEPRLDELLIRAVHATSAATRLVAVQALGQHETPSRRAVLVDACLNDQDEKIRAASATVIRGYQGDEGIHDLITHLAQGEPTVGIRAADALALIGDELAVTPLADALSDEFPLLQISAARALRLLEPPYAGRVIDPLVNIAVTHPDTEIRLLAVKELDQIQGGIDRLFVPFDDAFDAGRYEDALRLLDGMAILITDLTRLHWMRAWTLRYLQRLPEALEEVDAVLYNSPDGADALDLRADLLFGLGRGDEGLTAIKEAAERRPDDAGLKASLGWWSYVSGRFDESIQASQYAIELQPDNVGARLNLGLALLASGDDALVEQTYQQAIEQASLGDRSEGVTQLTTAIEELGKLEQHSGVQKAITGAVRNLLQAGVDSLNTIQRRSAAGDVAGD
jgi:HEAT repeat protein